MTRIRLCHLISGLGLGGAELVLYKLLAGMDRTAFEAEVISMTTMGATGEKIQQLGIPVHTLHMRRSIPSPRGLWQLVSHLRQNAPTLIQTWMYHADLLGALASQCAGHIPVVWGIHHTNLTPGMNKRLTIWTAQTCGRLSRRLPAAIVCCAEASRRVHVGLGYTADKMVVIPNGFDLDTFQPRPDARPAIRRELGIPEDTALIGMVARFHPQKDHYTFVQAAAALHARLPEAHFLLCGHAVSWDNADLRAWIEQAGIKTRCHLLGLRDDMPRIYGALDVATSSSVGEAFPSALGEAMACRVPCVVTDTGDSARIVGDTGRVVPPGNPRALAEAWQEVLELGESSRRQLGEAARQRIEQSFSLPAVTARYERLYATVAARMAA